MTALTLPAAGRGAGPRLVVDLTAVAANVRLFTERATGELMAVVKADGFGHGAVDVARTSLAHGATRLGVTSIDEAMALRAAGIGAPVLSWLNPVDTDFAAAVAAGVELAVPGREHLDAITRRAPGARIHLQLDTGMARDGAAPSEWTALCRAARLAERRGLLRVVGVMGHLATADVPADHANATGRTRFAWGLEVARGCGLRPADRHLAATSATLTDPLSHHTMSRVGAGLVGIDPSRTTSLRPALTLTAPLVSVRRVRAGTGVGYGHTWTAPAPTTLGLVPLGYADGLPRAASGCAEVLVRGRRHLLVGRISMDMAVVDLQGDHAEPGDVVTLFGPGDRGEPTVAEWAGWADTIEHEIVTGLGSRLQRTVRGTHEGRCATSSTSGHLRRVR
jgi:alanine racemase